jgi:hypothetical protein
MRADAHALDAPLRSRKVPTAEVGAGQGRRRPLPVQRAHLILLLLAVTVAALVALPGSGTGPEASCRGAVHTGEFACLEGQRPEVRPGRGCVPDGSSYRITFWRCALEK